MRPQFGSPPCSAVFTSGELAIARAVRSTFGPWPPRTTTRPIRSLPSPSRTIASASSRSSASSASPKARSPSDCGSTITPEAPLAWRIAVSFVESWPSTEIRSKLRCTQTDSSRSAVSALSTRVGLHEAEHRREARLDHPGALGLRGQAHRPARQVDGERRPLLEQVGRHDRPLQVARAVRAQLAARGGEALDDGARVERHADHAGRADRDLILGDAGAHRRGALHLRRVLQAHRAGRRVRVAAVDDDRADRVQAAALAREQHRRGGRARSA